jgi:hypothetical protein
MINRLVALALAGALSLGPISQAPAAQGTGCMPTTGTISGLTFAQDVNAGIAALISSNSGATAPATDCTAVAIKGQVWLDTSVTPNLLKQYDGSSTWVVIGALDASNHLWAPPVGGGSATVTAASTTDICAAPSAVQNISGTTTITSFGTACVPGVRKTLIFGDATPMTYNATSLIIPGQRSYTATAGDVADAIYLGSGNWRILNISRIDGSSVTATAVPLGTIQYGDYAVAPAKSLLGFGQAVSRATYPDYFAAVTRTQTGTLTSGSATVTSVGNTAGLGAGMPVEGTGVQSGTVINSVTSSTIVMSKTATGNGSASISVIIPGYGSGGDSTTVGVKDCRGMTMAGRTDMGGTDLANLTATYFGAVTGQSGKRIGAKGGREDQPLTTSMIPDLTSNRSQNILVDTNSSSIVVSSGLTTFSNGTGTSFQAFTNGTAVASQQQAQRSNVITVDTLSTGGSAPVHPNVQPTTIAECVVVMLP